MKAMKLEIPTGELVEMAVVTSSMNTLNVAGQSSGTNPDGTSGTLRVVLDQVRRR